MRLAFIILAAIGLGSCILSTTAPEDQALRGALIAEIQEAADGDTIDLQTILGSGWDRLAILGPYAPDKSAEDLLGFAFPVEDLSPWTYTEGGDVFVLANGQRLVSWFGLPSVNGGVDCLYGDVYRSDTKFTVIEDHDGYRELALRGRFECSHLFEPD